MQTSPIASHVPGRLRLRAAPLRRAAASAALAAEMRSWPEVSRVEANPRTGGLLALYDRGIGDEAFAARVLAAFAAHCGGAEAARPRRQAPRKLALPGLDLRDWNRTAKIGGLATMAALLAVLPASRAAHAALGVAHLGFLALHLANHRKKLLQ